MGLETEYAIRIKRVVGSQSKPAFDFERFSECLAAELPCARSFRNHERIYLANGGCVSLERAFSFTPGDVLLEAATPECQSPRDLIRYQIAMEQLFVETLANTHLQQNAKLIKGNTDAHGHTYGQHESYEVRIASGWRLAGWRLGLVMLLPMLVLYQACAAAWIFILWLLGQITNQISILIRRTKKQSLDELPPNFRLWSMHPRWIKLCAIGLRLMHFPVACGLWLNIFCFALIPHRRYLTAFFASRCILDGAGYLDQANRFWVSVRAACVNSTIGFGSYRFERPIFRCDAWLRGLCLDPIWKPASYLKLFRAHQRVEIAIGDSGLCQQSQYVRIGATSLVLDMVERTTPEVPRLQNSIEAIVKFSKDWMLLTSVSDRSRRQWTALEIQHAFASSVRHFLQTQNNVPIEAWRILDQWQTTLNQLHPTDDESNLPRNMLGRVDWLSKLWLLHQMQGDVSWQVRKKIDLRYHELSNEGYFERLFSILNVAPIIETREIERAKRTPPQGTPATQRGYVIREFADSDSNMRCDWNRAEFQFDDRKRTVRF